MKLIGAMMLAISIAFMNIAIANVVVIVYPKKYRIVKNITVSVMANAGTLLALSVTISFAERVLINFPRFFV